MGQEHEFNVRYVRGKGVQITTLSTRSSRFYWVSIGMTVGLSASNLAYHFTRSIPMGVAISAGLLVANMLGQITHLVILYIRHRAMLAGIGMSEKEMLAMIDKIVTEGEERLDVMKREAASKLDEMQSKNNKGE
jgi:hypothetical protein